jgi:hypothetical protein
MNTTEHLPENIPNFFVCYWPVFLCPFVTFAMWNGPSGINLLFALLVMREHRRWRGPWAATICSLVSIGCVFASAVSVFMHLHFKWN